MNKSTLVPREEMNDLDWLARNVHEWPAGDHQPWCYVYWKGGHRAVSGNCITVIQPCARIEKADWLARRAELQNKPSWNDWPQWDFMAQNRNGCWIISNRELIAGEDGRWHGYGVVTSKGAGEVLGDWRDTLEKRPEQLKPEVKPEFCESVMRSIPEPEAQPTIEQLAADYHNRKDYAERKQQEADDAKADAEAKLAELVAAGKALGLVLAVAELEPEMVITDWRDLQVGDVVWYGGDDELSPGEYHVMEIEAPDYEGYRTVLVNGGNGGHWIDTRAGWRFIRCS